jgi:hypothetical protein
MSKLQKRNEKLQAQALQRVVDVSERLGLYEAEIDDLGLQEQANAPTQAAIQAVWVGKVTPIGVDEL